MPTEELTIAAVAKLLNGYRLRFSNEALLQADVAKVLKLAEVEFHAEWSFSKSDRVDFWIPSIGLAMECKVDGGPSPVFSQLLRYAGHECVNAVLLVTSRQAHRLPVESLNNKPFQVVWVGMI